MIAWDIHRHSLLRGCMELCYGHPPISKYHRSFWKTWLWIKLGSLKQLTVYLLWAWKAPVLQGVRGVTTPHGCSSALGNHRLTTFPSATAVASCHGRARRGVSLPLRVTPFFRFVPPFVELFKLNITDTALCLFRRLSPCKNPHSLPSSFVLIRYKGVVRCSYLLSIRFSLSRTRSVSSFPLAHHKCI